MPRKQDRSNAYYLRQLELRHPDVYSEYLAGKYASLREALLATGIRKSRSRLHEMKNAWLKASAPERKEFDRWLSTQTGAGSKSSGTPRLLAGPPIAINRRLEPWAKSRITMIMKKRRLSMGEVMVELGFPSMNGSLGLALNRGARLQPDVLAALERWISDNAAI
jgi:hypothetical protein